MYSKTVQLDMRKLDRPGAASTRLGAKITFYPPRPKTDKYLKSFFYQGALEWNKLPLQMRTIATPYQLNIGTIHLLAGLPFDGEDEFQSFMSVQICIRTRPYNN